MTNALTLAAKKTFDHAQLDFYRYNDEYYMTRTQIGQALGYSDPRVAITKIHERNADRLDSLSSVVKLVTEVTGEKGTYTQTRDTFVYNLRGVMEICRLSRKPVADKFMDFVWDVMESLYHGDMLLTTPDQQVGISSEAFQAMTDSVLQIEKTLYKMSNTMILFDKRMSTLEQTVQQLHLPAPQAKQQLPAHSGEHPVYRQKSISSSDWRKDVYDTIDKINKNQPGRFADGKATLGYIYRQMADEYGFSINREKGNYMKRHPRSLGNFAVITIIEDDEAWRKVFDRMLADLYQDSVDHSPLDENGNMPIPVRYDSKGLVEFGCPHTDPAPVEEAPVRDEPVVEVVPTAPAAQAAKTPNPANGARVDAAIQRVAASINDHTRHYARSYNAVYNIMQVDWDKTFRQYETKFGRKAHFRRELFAKSDVLTARLEAAADTVCAQNQN